MTERLNDHIRDRAYLLDIIHGLEIENEELKRENARLKARVLDGVKEDY